MRCGGDKGNSAGAIDTVRYMSKQQVVRDTAFVWPHALKFVKTASNKAAKEQHSCGRNAGVPETYSLVTRPEEQSTKSQLQVALLSLQSSRASLFFDVDSLKAISARLSTSEESHDGNNGQQTICVRSLPNGE